MSYLDHLAEEIEEKLIEMLVILRPSGTEIGDPEATRVIKETARDIADSYGG